MRFLAVHGLLRSSVVVVFVAGGLKAKTEASLAILNHNGPVVARHLGQCPCGRVSFADDAAVGRTTPITAVAGVLAVSIVVVAAITFFPMFSPKLTDNFSTNTLFPDLRRPPAVLLERGGALLPEAAPGRGGRRTKVRREYSRP